MLIKYKTQLSSLSFEDRVKQEFLGVVENAILDGLEERIDPGFFHPSELSTICDRALAFSILGLQKQSKISVQLARIFDNGTYVGQRIANYIKKAGLHRNLQQDFYDGGYNEEGIKEEKKFQYDDLRMRGSCDDVIFLEILGELCGVEIKSANDDNFKRVRETNTPKEEHLLQVNGYFLISPIKYFILLYENKNNQTWYLFLLTPNNEIMSKIVKRNNEIVRLLKLGDIPETIALPEGNRECPYFYMCDLVSNVGEAVKYRVVK